MFSDIMADGKISVTTINFNINYKASVLLLSLAHPPNRGFTLRVTIATVGGSITELATAAVVIQNVILTVSALTTYL